MRFESGTQGKDVVNKVTVKSSLVQLRNIFHGGVIW
jgi:hypothetical protein